MSRPATALEMPSQVCADSPPGRASPTTPRTTYGPNTNEVMTAFHDDEPQSQNAHASTRQRAIGAGPGSAAVGSTPVAVMTRARVRPGPT